MGGDRPQRRSTRVDANGSGRSILAQAGREPGRQAFILRPPLKAISAGAFFLDAINLCRRAFDGACWSVGISPRPHVSDTISVAATRVALARAVMGFASAGVRGVQATKISALKSVLCEPALAEAA